MTLPPDPRAGYPRRGCGKCTTIASEDPPLSLTRFYEKKENPAIFSPIREFLVSHMSACFQHLRELTLGGKGSGRKPYKRFTAPGDIALEHPWPVRDLSCDDTGLQDEAVAELQRLQAECIRVLVVDGAPNPLIEDLAEVERACLANHVIRPSKMALLLRMMAEGAIRNG